MAFTDGNTASATDTADETDSDAETEDTEPEEGDGRLAAALKKANKDGERLRRRLKELEDRDKTEIQKATEKAAELEQKATAAELRALRLEVALEAGLPKALAARLQGSTVEELQKDAKELLAFAGNGKPPPVSMDGGANTPPPSGDDMNKLIRNRMRR
jgi:hypothetical protein